MSHFCTHAFREPVAKAKTKVRTTSHYRRNLALARRMGAAVSVDLFQGLTRFKKRISADALLQAWRTGDYHKIMTTIPWDKLPHDLEPAFRKIASSVDDSARLSIPRLPANPDVNLRFDITNPAVNRYITRRTGNLVVGIQSDTQKILRSAVQRTFTEALTPRDVADQIKSSIGLYPAQEVALRNHARGLQVRGYPPQNIQASSANYAERLLDQRAMTIGRTEVRNATNHGQLSMWKEAADRDLIDRTTAMKRWVVDGDPCERCIAMDGDAVPIDQPWVMDDGTVCEVPSDAHPNCECGMELEYEGATAP